jgi:hypothetical protein
VGPKPRPAADRFWPKVDKRGPDECWGWKASTHLFGYGKFYVGLHPDGRKNLVDAHRFAWELHHGRRIPGGKLVMHTCDNPQCTNPAHLVLGTVPKNNADKQMKGRAAKSLTVQDVAEIRRRRAAGEKIVPLGKEFGITHAMVSHVCTRRSWGHV